MQCSFCGCLILKTTMTPKLARLSHTWSRYKYLQSTINCGIPWASSTFRHLLPANDFPVSKAFISHSTNLKSWSQPQGFDTGIKIYHPVVKDKVPLVLRQERLVQWYACGPTVYDSSHIGHASSYVRQDIIRRIMEDFFHIETILVMGVTDIDDKIIKKSLETGEAMSKLTKRFESEFFASMSSLNVLAPSMVTRVTEHIAPIINFIAAIEKKGLAYRVSDGSVYFDVNKYGRYGVFSNQTDQGVEINSEKHTSQDFALWKGSKPGEPWWESPWGKGRPGWHIECSAMASHIFGANFDLHSGGQDLIFPHHENELAQSCAYHNNTQWVNYWTHTGHLFLSGQTDKMSKSLKNVISIPELLDQYSSNQFRMLCLLSHYRKQLEFSDERMQKAVSVVTTLNSLVDRCKLYVDGQINSRPLPEAELYENLHNTRRLVHQAFADDFNTPQALAHVMRLVKLVNQYLGGESDANSSVGETSARCIAPVVAVEVFIRGLLKKLGLDIGTAKTGNLTESQQQFCQAVDTVVSTRAKIREFARNDKFMLDAAGELGIPEEKAKQLMKKLYKPLWEASDKIREEILNSSNVQIKDDANSSSWSFVDNKKARISSTETKQTSEETKLKSDVAKKDKSKKKGKSQKPS
ncbi:probable cysteine--tRNA ligase, mitochondrial [Physella acuta]|uniref:probable cysteine--tRNA ligase, mitochondrial n=1 Tax=Physella acuta TaxID=109671 RepID=UPI0027DB08F7|nr:probable cysteine--tRNA ligase, mitochondrial [Physella acuta]XP_059144805.1 probable cysteine--tRNA ligase, mitochondrial [Physella acuta]